MHLLLVEDDERLARALTRLLEEDRHVVEHAPDGRTGLELATAIDGLDAVILDIGLPDMSGLDVARRDPQAGDRREHPDAHRPRHRQRPRDRPRRRGRRLRREAVRLPGDRRPPAGPRPAAPSPGPAARSPGSRSVRSCSTRRRGASPSTAANVDLSPREFSLLEALLRHPGQVLTRDQLLDHAWPFSVAVTPNAVDAYVHYLRTKLGDAGRAGRDRPRRGVPARRWLTGSAIDPATTAPSGRPSPTRPGWSGASGWRLVAVERRLDAGRAGRSWPPRSTRWWPTRSSRRPINQLQNRISPIVAALDRHPAVGQRPARPPGVRVRGRQHAACSSSTPRASRCSSATGRSSCPRACPRRPASRRAKASPDGVDVRMATLQIASGTGVAATSVPDPDPHPAGGRAPGRQHLLPPGPPGPLDRGRDAPRPADGAAGRRAAGGDRVHRLRDRVCPAGAGADPRVAGVAARGAPTAAGVRRRREPRAADAAHGHPVLRGAPGPAPGPQDR